MLLSLARAAGEVGLSLAPVGAMPIANTLILRKKRDLTKTVIPGRMIHGMIRMLMTVTGISSGARTPLHKSTRVLNLPIGLRILPFRATILHLLLPLLNSTRNNGNSQTLSGSLHKEACSMVPLQPLPLVPLISLPATFLPLLSLLPLLLCTLILATPLFLKLGHSRWQDSSSFSLLLPPFPQQLLYRRGGIPRAGQGGAMEVAQGATKGAIRVAFLARVRPIKEDKPVLPNRLFKIKAHLNSSPPRAEANSNKSLLLLMGT